MSVDARVRAALTGAFFRLADLRKLVADAEANIKTLEGELAALNDKLSDPALDPWFRDNGDTFQRSELTKRNLEIARRGLEKLKPMLAQRIKSAPERKQRLKAALENQNTVVEETSKIFPILTTTLAELVKNVADIDRELGCGLISA